MYLVIRDCFAAFTRKLVPEVLVSALATLLVTAMFSNVLKAPAAPQRANGAAVAISDQTTADFMERVALSHVGTKSQAAVASGADTPVLPQAPATVTLPAAAHAKTHTPIVHTSASTPDVLPPPRPQLATVEPAVVIAEPPKVKPIAPLRYGMHLVTQVVDFVPASGARVFEGMTSVGGALASFAKKL